MAKAGTAEGELPINAPANEAKADDEDEEEEDEEEEDAGGEVTPLNNCS